MRNYFSWFEEGDFFFLICISVTLAWTSFHLLLLKRKNAFLFVCKVDSRESKFNKERSFIAKPILIERIFLSPHSIYLSVNSLNWKEKKLTFLYLFHSRLITVSTYIKTASSTCGTCIAVALCEYAAIMLMTPSSFLLSSNDERS